MKSGTRGNKLQEKHKEYVVKRLACYDTPKEVAEGLKEEFNLKMTLQGIEYYNPKRAAGKCLSEKWRLMFEETRRHFLDNAAEYVPLANKTVRLAELSKMHAAHKSRNNHVAAAQVIEQIAKEVGGSFTNRREHTGRDGGAIETQHSDLTDDQIDQRLAELLESMGKSDV